MESKREKLPYIGDKVWALSGAYLLEGEVSSVTESGCYIKTYHNNHFHPYQRVYFKPQEAKKLYHELIENADYLYNAAQEVKKEIK